MLSISFLLLGILLLLSRLYLILPRGNPQTSRPRGRHESGPCSLAVFLGSGGHTSEALRLISAVDFRRYTPRTYIVSEGDILSAQKATALELSKAGDAISQANDSNQYTVLTIPRARRVHQALLLTPPTAVFSLMICLYYVMVVPIFSPKRRRYTFADVLVLNGPGTCFVLCIAVYINKFLGLPTPRIIYVESFARVQSLSLSGRLLRSLVDRFVVQWPQLLRDRGRGECHDWLV